MGVAFAIRNGIVGLLPCLPQGINDHLISLCLSLRAGQFTTIDIACVRTMNGSDKTKTKFYEDLHAILSSVLKLANLRRTPPPADQHTLPPADEEECDLDVPPIANLAAAGRCSHPAARLAGRDGDQGDKRH
nr:unnamed protein product [Spirometra erinaceieuropaei]